MAYASYSSGASYAKPPPPKAAQKLTKQREIAEYADFGTRGLALPGGPSVPAPVRVDGKHREVVRSIAFSKSGRVVVTGGADRTVRFWDVRYRREAGAKVGDEVSFVYNASRSPLLPSASSDTTGAASKPTTTAEAPILRLAFSPADEDLLAIALAARSASGARDREKREAEGPAVVLWDVNPTNPHMLASFPLDGEFQSIAFHPSGLALAIACFRRSAWDAVVFLWDEEAVRRREGAEGEQAEGMQVDVGTTTEQVSARRWAVRRDIKLGDRNYRLRDRRGREWGVRELNGLCFSPDGRRLYAGETSGNIFAWEYPVLPAPVPQPAADDAVAGTNPSADVNMSDGASAQQNLEASKAGGLSADQANGDGADTAAPSVLPSREASPVHEGDGRGGSPPREEQDEEESGDLAETGRDGGGEGETGETSGETLDAQNGADPMHLQAIISAGQALNGTVGEQTSDKQEAEPGVEASPPGSTSKPAEETAPPKADEEDVAMTDATAPAAEEAEKETTPAAAASSTAQLAPVGLSDQSPAADDAPAETLREDKPEIPTITVDADGDTEMKPAEMAADPEAAAEPKSATPSREAQGEVKKDGPAAPAAADAAPAEIAKPKAPEIPAKMLKYLFQVGCHSGCANCLEVSPNGRFVATGGSEGVVNQIDLSSWITVRAYDSYTEEVRNVKCSYDGEWIAVAGDDRCIDIMSVVSGTTALRIPTKTKVECMAWVPIRSKSVLCFSLEDHPSGAAGQAGDWFWVEV